MCTWIPQHRKVSPAVPFLFEGRWNLLRNIREKCVHRFLQLLLGGGVDDSILEILVDGDFGHSLPAVHDLLLVLIIKLVDDLAHVVCLILRRHLLDQAHRLNYLTGLGSHDVEIRPYLAGQIISAVMRCPKGKRLAKCDIVLGRVVTGACDAVPLFHAPLDAFSFDQRIGVVRCLLIGDANITGRLIRCYESLQRLCRMLRYVFGFSHMRGVPAGTSSVVLLLSYINIPCRFFAGLESAVSVYKGALTIADTTNLFIRYWGKCRARFFRVCRILRTIHNPLDIGLCQRSPAGAHHFQ